jgi:hypothetical protein
MKRIIKLLFFLLISAEIYAPEYRTICVEYTPPVDCYARLIDAIGFVESSHNDSAINHSEQAYGFFQVRQIRLDDYYQRTGIRYELSDMLNRGKAEKVFRYYARGRDYEKIARDWNGSGRGTDRYWNKVRQLIPDKV